MDNQAVQPAVSTFVVLFSDSVLPFWKLTDQAYLLNFVFPPDLQTYKSDIYGGNHSQEPLINIENILYFLLTVSNTFLI